MKIFDNFRRIAIISIITTFFMIITGGAVRSGASGLTGICWPPNWSARWSVGESPGVLEHILKSKFEVAIELLGCAHVLFGLISGILISASAIISIRRFRARSSITITAVLTFLFACVEIWLGINLARDSSDAALITAHSIIAATIISLQAHMVLASNNAARKSLQIKAKRELAIIGAIMLVLTSAQFLLGSQARAAIDSIVRNAPNIARESWISQGGITQEIHRSFSWLLLLVSFLAFSRSRKLKTPIYFTRIAGVNLIAIGVQMLLGAILTYSSLPQSAQTLHLANAMIMIGAQIYFMREVLRAATAAGD